MIPQQAPERPMTMLLAGHTATGVVALVVAAVAVVLGGDGSVPTWLGLIVTAGVGMVAAFAARWFRRRPIEVGDFGSYRQTVLVRWAIAIDSTVVGAVMSLVGDSPWPAVVGGMITIIVLALAQVSEEDYMRHQAISIEEALQVPEEEWGTADPKAVAPWDQLEEGHGHGMHP